MTNYSYPADLPARPVNAIPVRVKDEPEPEPVRELRVVHTDDQANIARPVVKEEPELPQSDEESKCVRQTSTLTPLPPWLVT